MVFFFFLPDPISVYLSSLDLITEKSSNPNRLKNDFGDQILNPVLINLNIAKTAPMKLDGSYLKTIISDYSTE